MIKDLTGMKFGKLTVLKYVGNNKHRIAQWLCRCECGNEKIISGQCLIKGHTKSCGCLVFKDLTGKKFGRLTVIKRVESKNKNSMWLCRCECGNEKIVRGSHLTNNKIKSCGCYNKELISKRFCTHLKSKTRLYKIWQNMKKRCYNKYSTYYQNYGGRGIKVCDKWKNNFVNFYNWAINNGYKKNLTIDRINVNGNYEPENCKWSNAKEQARNRSNNHLITYKGETHCIAEWAEIIGIIKGTLEHRLYAGWSIEKALTEPVRKR